MSITLYAFYFVCLYCMCCILLPYGVIKMYVCIALIYILKKNKQSLLARRSKLSVLNLLLTVTDSIFLSHILVPYNYLPRTVKEILFASTRFEILSLLCL